MQLVAKSDKPGDEGPARRFMRSCPVIEPWMEDIYRGFYLCDRDGMSGALTFRGMLEVLIWMGIHSHAEQEDWMSLYREMDDARRKKRESLKAEKPDG